MLVFCSFQVAQRLLDELDASPTAAAELSDLEKFPYLRVRMQAHIHAHTFISHSHLYKHTLARTYKYA